MKDHGRQDTYFQRWVEIGLYTQEVRNGPPPRERIKGQTKTSTQGKAEKSLYPKKVIKYQRKSDMGIYPEKIIRDQR